MWKSKKDIEGVSASSILTLKSIVSNEEAQVKSQIEQGITHSKPTKSMGLVSGYSGDEDNYKSNKGVSQRNQRDVDVTDSEKGDSAINKSYNSLLTKSKLYNKLLNKHPSEITNNYNDDYGNNSDNSVLVDFQQKYIDSNDNDSSNNNSNNNNNFNFNNNGNIHSSRLIPGSGGNNNNNSIGLIHPELEREKKRKLWEQDILNEINKNSDDDDDDDNLEQLRKQQKIEDMKREEEQTKLNRAKVITEKDIHEKEKQDRLDQINKQKKLALLKQKLKEKQQQTATNNK